MKSIMSRDMYNKLKIQCLDKTNILKLVGALGESWKRAIQNCIGISWIKSNTCKLTYDD